MLYCWKFFFYAFIRAVLFSPCQCFKFGIVLLLCMSSVRWYCATNYRRLGLCTSKHKMLKLLMFTNCTILAFCWLLACKCCMWTCFIHIKSKYLEEVLQGSMHETLLLYVCSPWDNNVPFPYLNVKSIIVSFCYNIVCTNKV